MAASNPDSSAIQDNLDAFKDQFEDDSEEGRDDNNNVADDTKSDVESDGDRSPDDMSDLAQITEDKLRLSPGSKFTSSALFSSSSSSSVSPNESAAASISATNPHENELWQEETDPLTCFFSFESWANTKVVEDYCRKRKLDMPEFSLQKRTTKKGKLLYTAMGAVGAVKVTVEGKKRAKVEKRACSKVMTKLKLNEDKTQELKSSKTNNYDASEKNTKFHFSSASWNQRKALAEFCNKRNLSNPCFEIKATKNGYLATVTVGAKHFSLEGKKRSTLENGVCGRAMNKLVKAQKHAKNQKKLEQMLVQRNAKTMTKKEESVASVDEMNENLQEETSNGSNVYFSTESLEQRHALMTFCQKRNLPKPSFSIKTKNGGYEATVTVGSEQIKFEGPSKVKVENKLCSKAVEELGKTHRKGFRMLMEEMTMDMNQEELEKKRDEEQEEREEEVVYDEVEESVLVYYSDLDPLESRSLCALWTLCFKLNLSVYFARGANNSVEQQWVVQLRTVSEHEAIASTVGARINETFVGSGTSDEVAKKRALKQALNFLNELIERS